MSELETIVTSAGIVIGTIGFLGLLAYSSVQKIDYWGRVAESIKAYRERIGR